MDTQGSSDEKFTQMLRNLQIATASTSSDLSTKGPAADNRIHNPRQSFTSEGVIQPETYRTIQFSRDAIDDKIEKYLRKPIKIRAMDPTFEQLDITIGMKPVKKDFTDGELLDRGGFKMKILSNAVVAQVGRSWASMLSVGFSNRGLVAIFLLAANLQAPGTLGGAPKDRIFNGIEKLNNELLDTEYDSYPDILPGNINRRYLIAPIRDEQHEAKVYSYIAASLLRLFRKSSENYVKSWRHIVDGFKKFYGEECLVNLPDPVGNAIQQIVGFFSLDDRAKISLYRILYEGNKNTVAEGMKMFLYDIHLTNTGMHIVSMFVELCKILNCEPGIILTIINEKEFERQVICMLALLKLLKNEDINHTRKMWRYGRIFDDSFMSDLQTKSCPRLVCVFAYALKLEAPESHEGILEIVQLGDLSDKTKKLCAAAAKKLLNKIRAMTSDAEVIPFVRRWDNKGPN